MATACAAMTVNLFGDMEIKDCAFAIIACAKRNYTYQRGV